MVITGGMGMVVEGLPVDNVEPLYLVDEHLRYVTVNVPWVNTSFCLNNIQSLTGEGFKFWPELSHVTLNNRSPWNSGMIDTGRTRTEWVFRNTPKTCRNDSD